MKRSVVVSFTFLVVTQKPSNIHLNQSKESGYRLLQFHSLWHHLNTKVYQARIPRLQRDVYSIHPSKRFYD